MIRPSASSAEGAHVARKNVLVAGLPHLLATIVSQALADEPGIGRLTQSAAAPEHASSVPGDVTHLITAGSMPPVVAARLLEARPDLSVVLITSDAVGAAVLELWPVRRELGELSPHGLRSAIRETTRWPDRFASAGEGEPAGAPA